MRVSSSTFSSLLMTVYCASLKFAPSKTEPLKIIDGAEITPHSLPYMVAIRSNMEDRSVLCGGSLLSISLVLTAATCVYGASEADVILGAHNLDTNESNQIVMSSTDFMIHEKYSTQSKTYDIALISLPSTVPLNEYISLIKLPTFSDIFNSYDGQEGIVAGWGKTGDTATTSSVLRAANLTIIPVLVCELTQAFQITIDQMCTSGVSKKNICRGDAGSPLVVGGVQVGIASYGSDFGCGVGFPAVYTRITSYLGWLSSGMN